MILNKYLYLYLYKEKLSLNIIKGSHDIVLYLFKFLALRKLYKISSYATIVTPKQKAINTLVQCYTTWHLLFWTYRYLIIYMSKKSLKFSSLLPNKGTLNKWFFIIRKIFLL